MFDVYGEKGRLKTTVIARTTFTDIYLGPRAPRNPHTQGTPGKINLSSTPTPLVLTHKSLPDTDSASFPQDSYKFYLSNKSTNNAVYNQNYKKGLPRLVEPHSKGFISC